MSYAALHNANELKVLLLSWVFACNFQPTFEILLQGDDISAIADSLPDTPLTRKARDVVFACIDSRLRSINETKQGGSLLLAQSNHSGWVRL